ncbi:MAG: hypothetical protein COC13_00605 [Methanobacteriota archaeon]|nr:MAG: hypothetical protein COC13_00605 [Euryarchaeota archaeon]
MGGKTTEDGKNKKEQETSKCRKEEKFIPSVNWNIGLYLPHQETHENCNRKLEEKNWARQHIEV